VSTALSALSALSTLSALSALSVEVSGAEVSGLGAAESSSTGDVQAKLSARITREVQD
jgi:hypothetical protein